MKYNPVNFTINMLECIQGERKKKIINKEKII